MGFLDTPGKSLTMDEIKEHKNLHHKAIAQFLKIYQKYKNIQRANLKFGDEVEYYIAYNGENRISLLLSANEMCDNINEDLLVRKNINFRPEYAKWMIESIPKNPYNNTLEEIDCVEKNMYARRKFIKERLPRHCDIYAVSAFPRMGCPYFNVQYDPNFISPYSLSTNIDDKCINDHIRFSTLTRNIRKRKGKKVGMTIPIQQDKLTTKKNIDIDCMAFGMGCNCLQVTFECPNLKKARFLYDQFAILTPIFLALTASSPMLMGYLMDRDHRWDIICAAVDDRTEQEMNSSHSEYQPKSRYSSISTYLSEEIYEQREYYNNVKFRKNKDVYRQLGKEVDPLLADHVSYLFSRDFITLFSNSIDNWEDNTNLFESIQTSNWNNVRVKLPENDDDGWKMEFRPMEIQYTDFENSAFVVFSLLLFNLLMDTAINFYIPSIVIILR